MAGYRPEGPIIRYVSPYLQRPLRTLKEAEQDSGASAHQSSLPSPPESPAPPPPVSAVHQNTATPIHPVIIAL